MAAIQIITSQRPPHGPSPHAGQRSSRQPHTKYAARPTTSPATPATSPPPWARSAGARPVLVCDAVSAPPEPALPAVPPAPAPRSPPWPPTTPEGVAVPVPETAPEPPAGAAVEAAASCDAVVVMLMSMSIMVSVPVMVIMLVMPSLSVIIMVAAAPPGSVVTMTPPAASVKLETTPMVPVAVLSREAEPISTPVALIVSPEEMSAPPTGPGAKGSGGAVAVAEPVEGAAVAEARAAAADWYASRVPAPELDDDQATGV